jgi:hypothetical protein
VRKKMVVTIDAVYILRKGMKKWFYIKELKASVQIK